MFSMSPLSAHEFWLNPQKYQVQSGDTVRVEFRNGEKFSGAQLAYFDRSTTRLQVLQAGKVSTPKPRDGDKPAVSVSKTKPGLMVVAHETSRSTLRYKTWAKFKKFTNHKKFTDMEARHDKRGLPREGFTESYTRHAKTLIAVGPGTGSDKRFGMVTEFVAKTNPYEATYKQKFSAQLLYKGKPRANAPVEIFDRPPSGPVRVSFTQTDGNGASCAPCCACYNGDFSCQ